MNSKAICPLCSSTQIKPLYKITARDIFSHLHVTEDAELTTIINDLWNDDQAVFYKCTNCELGFAWPFIAANEQFYSKIYNNDVNYPSEKWDYKITYEAIAKILKNLTDKNIHLLEIGAGNGAFIKKISPSLLKKQNVLCTEFSEYGKKEILDYGINCVSKDITEMNSIYSNNKFDIVCMFQVLEHLDNISVFFENLNKITTMGCHLFITVPNNKYREFYDSLHLNLDIPPIHISRWSLKSFMILAKKSNWEIVEYYIENPKFITKFRKFLFNRYNLLKINKHIENIKYKKLNLFFKSIVLFILIFRYFPHVIWLLKSNLGVAQWVHLKKIKTV